MAPVRAATSRRLAATARSRRDPRPEAAVLMLGVRLPAGRDRGRAHVPEDLVSRLGTSGLLTDDLALSLHVPSNGRERHAALLAGAP
jgi:hypothetical protein